MTVSYIRDMNNASFSVFAKICSRWRGSIWKAVYLELLVWLITYSVIAFIYRILLPEEQQRLFERVCTYFNKNREFVPLTFMLGFFVSLVIGRWWTMYTNVGWIDVCALHIRNFVIGSDEESKIARRNLVRHVMFFQCLVYRDICICVRERFPTMETLVAAGYLTFEELKGFESIKSQYGKYHVAMQWIIGGIKRQRVDGRIQSDTEMRMLCDRAIQWRGMMGALLDHDTTPVPLLYTQVVCIIVRLYFAMALLASQNLIQVEEAYKEPITMYVPVLTILQFIFYIGWLKVAEALLNPFGGDDDDFEINWLLDRNMEVGYIIVNEDNFMPPIVKDIHWGQQIIEPLYNINADHIRNASAMNPSMYDEPVRSKSITMAPRAAGGNYQEQDVPVYIDRSLSIATQPESGIFRRKKISCVSISDRSLAEMETGEDGNSLPPTPSYARRKSTLSWLHRKSTHSTHSNRKPSHNHLERVGSRKHSIGTELTTTKEENKEQNGNTIDPKRRSCKFSGNSDNTNSLTVVTEEDEKCPSEKGGNESGIQSENGSEKEEKKGEK